MTFLQVVLDRRGDLRSATLRVVGHFVEALAVIVVLQLAEGSHATVEIVVDDGESVSVVVERFPSGELQVLRVVGEVHAALQHILASHGREAVEIHANDQEGVVGEERRQLVVDGLLVEIELVELRKLEVEVVVGIII